MTLKTEDNLRFADLPRGSSSSGMSLKQDKDKDIGERRIWIDAEDGSDEVI